VNGASLEGEGWRVFADTLIEFVNDCDLLVSNHERTIYIPFHKNIQLNKGDSLTDDGKQARVKLSGLNCLTGYDVFKSSGDLSDILKGNLLSGSSNRIQYIHELIDNHRVLIEHKDNVERDKKLENFEGQIDGFKSLLASLISENKDLRSEVSELSVTLIDALKKLDALKTSQDTLAIIKRPGIFSQILPDEKPTAEIKEQTSLRKHQSTSPV
jgi:regulator of replication initiation timing